MIFKIETPLGTDLSHAVVGTQVEISGVIYTARDAILPKIVEMIKNGSIKDFPVSLIGSAIMHTAFSPAGFGPTSSNKDEIEGSMGILSQAGVRLHIGKGIIKQQTVDEISKHGSIFIVMPSVSALLQSRLLQKKIVAFKEEGMEAMFELKVDNLPGIIAAARGKSIFSG